MRESPDVHEPLVQVELIPAQCISAETRNPWR